MPANDRAYLILAARIIGEFGAIIAVPAVLAALAGKWLDARFGTRPLFLVVGFALAASCSAVMIDRKAKKFAEEYDAIIKREKETKKE